jgi:hypothetical protein
MFINVCKINFTCSEKFHFQLLWTKTGFNGHINFFTMKKCLAFILLLFIAQKIFAQNTVSQKPCSAPEALQFDFWVGD